MNSDLVWNRACQGGGHRPHAGDTALAALLLFHGAAMNGGVLHAVECLDAGQLRAAKDGYRYFGFPEIAELLVRAQGIADTKENLGEYERRLDEEYLMHVPNDSVLVERFEERFLSNPLAFGPVN